MGDRRGRSGPLAPLALAALLFGGAPAAADGPEAAGVEAETVAEVMRVLDRYLDAINAHDIEAHLATLHFPHFRYASGELAIWRTAADVMPFRSDTAEEAGENLRAALHPDWHRSVWVGREIVQSGPGKVHVATRFSRRREDGSEIVAFDSLYVMALQDGRWGIKGRSSFAP